MRVRVGSRSSYYRGGTVVVRFSKPTSALCYTNSDCRSRCCARNRVRKVLVKPYKTVYNRYYGKRTTVKRYRKTYTGTATVRYVNGRKITRWNVRDRICQARRRLCPYNTRTSVYVEDNSSGGIVGAIVGVICCCIIICVCVMICRSRGGGDGDVVVVHDDYSHHSADVHIEVGDGYSHHSVSHHDSFHGDDHIEEVHDDHHDDGY